MNKKFKEWIVLPRIMDFLIILFILYVSIVLFTYAKETIFFADECYFANVARYIAVNKALPVFQQELYNGFAFYYPPLFSIIGAVFFLVFGQVGLFYCSLIIFIFLVVAMFFTIKYFFTSNTAKIAILLLISSPIMMVYSLRFYSEILSALMFYLSFLAVFWFLQSGSRKAILIAGICNGLYLLTKQSAFLLLSFYLVCLVFFGIKKDKQRCKGITAIILLSIIIVFPYHLRKYLLFGNFFFPDIGDTYAPLFLQYARRSVSIAWWLLMKTILIHYGIVFSLSLGFIIVFSFILEKKKTLLFFPSLLFYLFIMLLILPAVTPRHFLFIVPLVNITTAVFLMEMLKGRWQYLAIGVLFIVSIYSFNKLENPRIYFNRPPAFAEAYRFLIENTEPDDNILSLWTYSTQYYTGRNAVWPSEKSPGAPSINIFLEEDINEFSQLLQQNGLAYILVDKSRINSKFNTLNYTTQFIDNIGKLIDVGKAEIVYDSEAIVIVKLEDELYYTSSL